MDLLTALENWVEKGAAPASIVVTKRDKDGRALWTRPTCPYPQAAKFRSGDPYDAASFSSAAP
jgi:feruloyl esterase